MQRLVELANKPIKLTSDIDKENILSAWEPLLLLLRKAEPNFKVRHKLTNKFWEMVEKHYGHQTPKKTQTEDQAAEVHNFQTQCFIASPS